MELTESQMLKYAMDNGIIDISTLQMQIEMNERIKYLEKHNHRIWQGTDGKWYTKLDDDTKKDGRRLVKRKTKEEIEDEVVEYYKELENEPTIRMAFDMWITQKLSFGEVQKQTAERYKQDFERFFEDNSIADKRIKYISEIDLEEFVKTSIYEKQLNSKAFGNLRTILNGIFKFAKKRGYTNISITSFFGDLDLSRKSFAKRYKADEECVFSEKEMKILTEYLFKNPLLGNLGILFAAYTGMRVGEIVALKWEDITDKYIYVHRTQIRYRGEDGKYVYEVRDSPKTDAGVRKVIIVDKLRPVIRLLRMQNPFTEYVFQKGEQPATKYVVEMSLYRACAKVGIPRRSMHVFRKTYATRLLNSHVDEAIIINQLGHTDIETTRQYYYFNDKNLDRMAEMIGAVINY